MARNGTAATAAGRVQKYLCQPPDTAGHSFTLPLPGSQPDPRPPRGHRYDAPVIARALHALARGASYRQARIAALGAADAPPGPPGALPDAKLISRWLDSFGPLLQQELSLPHPPPVAVARAVAVRRAARAAPQPGHWLLCLAGCEPGAPPRLWPAVLAARPDVAAWQGVFRQCARRPALLLCESADQEAAAVSVWGEQLLAVADPRPGESRPGANSGRALLWLPDDEDVTGHAMPAGTDQAFRSAAAASGAADAAVRRLASRAALIRTSQRADTLLGLMALQLSGLATTTTITHVLARS